MRRFQCSRLFSICCCSAILVLHVSYVCFHLWGAEVNQAVLQNQQKAASEEGAAEQAHQWVERRC